MPMGAGPMDNAEGGWKHKIFHGMAEYYMNAAYLSFILSVFSWHRRLVLAEYQISYFHYGISFLEALVLAKVVMLGSIFRFGRKLESKPLIIPTFYKAFVFSVLVGIFNIIERTISGLLHGRGLTGAIDELTGRGRYGFVAGCLVAFAAFMPFFAFRELGRVLGKDKIRGLFFRKRAAAEFDPPDD